MPKACKTEMTAPKQLESGRMVSIPREPSLFLKNRRWFYSQLMFAARPCADAEPSKMTLIACTKEKRFMPFSIATRRDRFTAQSHGI